MSVKIAKINRNVQLSFQLESAIWPSGKVSGFEAEVCAIESRKISEVGTWRRSCVVVLLLSIKKYPKWDLAAQFRSRSRRSKDVGSMPSHLMVPPPWEIVSPSGVFYHVRDRGPGGGW